MKTLCLAGLLFFSSAVFAKIEVYKITENTGLNKLERIDGIENYLVSLSVNLKNMSSKLDETNKKMEELDRDIKTLKENESKRVETALGDKRTDLPAATAEIEKLKADFLALKNEDIEQLKKDLQVLSTSLKELKPAR